MADALGRIDIYLVVNSSGDKLMADNIDCCCGPSPCLPPTQWAIVDYTNGFDILLSGQCIANQPRPPDGAATGGILQGFPGQPWRTRGYTSTLTPLKLGVFFLCPDPGIWLSAETWEVPVNHCCGGAWWGEHQFPASFTDPCCGEDWISDGTAAPFGEYFANHFHGGVDYEWTNMRNWSSPETTNPWEMKLPDSTVDVTISGLVRSNAACPANVKDLLLSGGTVGIEIKAAGAVTSNTGNVIRPSPDCPDFYGIIDAQGEITFSNGSQNWGLLKSATNISINDVSVNHVEGVINSTGGVVAFYGLATNYGDVYGNAIGNPAGYSIVFHENSHNECGRLYSVTYFKDQSFNTGQCSDSHYFHADVTFADDSTNLTPIGMDNFDSLEFKGNAKNESTITVGNGDSVVFSGSAKNNGTIVASPGAFGFTVSFTGGSINETGGSVLLDVTFEDESTNKGSAGGSLVVFSDNAKNEGTVNNDAEFRDSSKNSASGVVIDEATFLNQSENVYGGTCQGQADFRDTSKNYGILSTGYFYDSSANHATGNSATAFGSSVETGNFYGSSTNVGNVQYGNFYDSATNPGSVGEVTNPNSGSAVFNGNSNHTGIVYGSATFNDSSNNNGTVTGTVTCNTTGNC